MTDVGDVPPPAPSDLEVELPTVEPTPVAGFRRPEVGCEPAGCVRWSLDVGHGSTSTLAHGVYHVTRDALVAIDSDDGTVRWRASLLRAGARLLDDTVLPSAPADQVVLTRDPEALQAWDVATGALLWDVTWPAASRLAGAGLVDGHVLLATVGVLPSFEDGALDQGDHRSHGNGVLALDAGSGQPRWMHEVERVVGLTPHPLVVTHEGDVVALSADTGGTRWRHRAVVASADVAGGEVVVADAAGVTVLDAATGVALDRVAVDLEEALAATSGAPSPSGPGADVRVEVHDRLVGVGTVRRDGAGRPVRDAWELALFDRTDGTELRRFASASAWRATGDGLLVVLAGSDGDVHLTALSTTDAGEAWGRPLDATSTVRLDERSARPDADLLVEVTDASGHVEVLSVDPYTGQDVGRHGGAGWEPVGGGILAFSAREPVPGSVNVARLAGPDGSVAFTRQVTIVSFEPMLVRYWDHLIRIDERLLRGAPSRD